MRVLYKDDAFSTLVSSITNVQTTITLPAGEGARFPSPTSTGEAFFVSVEGGGLKERMRCTSRAGDILTVVRGQSGTVASAFSATAAVGIRVNTALLDSKVGTIAAGFGLSIYVSPTGDNTTGTGALAAPYLTIAKAIDSVRGLTTTGGWVNIFLNDGVYLQTVSLELPHLLGNQLSVTTVTNFEALFTVPATVSEFGAIRANSIAYTAGRFVIPATTNDLWYECTVAGTTGAAPPTFGTVVGGTTVDGTVTWTARNYHDVTMTHSTTNAPTFIVGSYLFSSEPNLHHGTHKVIAVASGSVTYRVFDYAARAIEAAPVGGLFRARNVVISTDNGTTVIEHRYNPSGEYATLGQVVIDGTTRAAGATGYMGRTGGRINMNAASFVNLYAGAELAQGDRASVGSISNCDYGVMAYNNSRASAGSINGCVFGIEAAAGSTVTSGLTVACGTGANLTGDSSVDCAQTKNCGTGATIANRSYAALSLINGCGLGVNITGGSYAEVTTFATNTSNSNLAVNTVGNFNSYVKN